MSDNGERSSRVEQNGFHGFVGRSGVLKDVVEGLEYFAGSDVPVLLTGESGTGKELAARAIVAIMAAEERSITVNCATIAGDLALSKIFGHRRGAFTGAVSDQAGLVAAADGGVLFLDEIGELTLPVQAKLLRVIEAGWYRPVGATEEHEARFRLVAATNRNLHSMVEQGTFRVDLLYRIAGVVIELPPLRDRLDDLPLLVDHFLRGDPVSPEPHRNLDLSDEAVELLMAHDWPGNVRELKSTIKAAASRTVAEGCDQIGADHVAPHLKPFSSGGITMREQEPPTLDQVRKQAEKQAISNALATSESTREAAERLGISEATLYRKKKEYGLTKAS